MAAVMGRNHLVVLCMAAAALMASLSAAAGEAAAAAPVQELRRGFSAAHDPSYSQFQPVLADPTGAFALGFLRVNSTMLDLAVLHLPSSFPLWRAMPDRPTPLSAAASLSFDGGLVLTDRAANKVLWSTAAASAAAAGDRAVLLNTSNLQIQITSGSGSSPSVVWQSFDYPSETIVQGQNFTSEAVLYTFDRRFAMRLGSNDFALYIEPPPSTSGGIAAAMYWKHTALEAKAQIVAGGGPTYARVEPDGFLGMYQKEGPPADVLSFDTFNRGVRALRRMTLEPDANLRAYYWDGARWVLDYTAITEPCELPTTCGAYSVCAQPSGRCACLANATDGSDCAAAIPASVGGGLCGTTGGEVGGLYWAVRKQRVEPVNKELLGFERAASVTDCEARCERNCSCWGAVYSNGTGYCYLMDYPAQLLVEGDERKIGYFKVRSLAEEAARGRGGGRVNAAKVALIAVGIATVVAAAVFGAYRVWDMRRRTAADARWWWQLGAADDGLSPGPYKNLGSFSSVELTNSFRR
ncbi:PAN domain-containing protein At5g03700-like [Phragmites australis]|uniref:PAN domain-containing protein At5g03700-like n=1 Tax=Phragmites australis TaxID=29695 RepID=UPI002D76D57C|nr:PAN domain-containing protein At5g03700-like [Phragmites australis]